MGWSDSISPYLFNGPEAFLFAGVGTLPDLDFNQYTDEATANGIVRQAVPNLPALQRITRASLQLLLPESISTAIPALWLDVVNNSALGGIVTRTIVHTALERARFAEPGLLRRHGCNLVDLKMSFQDLGTRRRRWWGAHCILLLWAAFILAMTTCRSVWLLSYATGALAAAVAHGLRDIPTARTGTRKSNSVLACTHTGPERLIVRLDLCGVPTQVHVRDILEQGLRNTTIGGIPATVAKFVGLALVAVHVAAINGDGWCRWGLAVMHMFSLVLARIHMPAVLVNSGVVTAAVTKISHVDFVLPACARAATSAEELGALINSMFYPNQRREDERQWLVHVWNGLQRGRALDELQEHYNIEKPVPESEKVARACAEIQAKFRGL